ncbi:MAG: hypothetical protein BWK80_16520 [Desulfobacteraceae bacterium IS3]|nr:MAG: hypothetical protein BWK80_16520 [Desulfobacteraceae bacterium IS3]
MLSVLQWGAAVFAVIAAALWLKSAMVKTPSSFPIHVVQPDSLSSPFGGPFGGTHVGQGQSPALKKLGEALCRQSKWSAAAAAFAAASALCQSFTIALDVAK